MTETYRIIVRGGGDLATGVIHRLWSAGFPVLVLETERPAAIRRQVSLCEAVYEGHTCVEGMKGVRISCWTEAEAVIAAGQIPVLVDPSGASIGLLRPDAVVDAIIAKKNMGTDRSMAPLTVGLGPGFCAGEDVDVVIETSRGHDLGRIIRQGYAKPDTGIPGNIGGYTAERVIHAQQAGVLRNVCEIGDLVERGDEIAQIQSEEGNTSVRASVSGVLRGLIRDGYPVTEGFKIADIDPRREEHKNCFSISDKARCIAGSVLEVICDDFFRKEKQRNGH